MLGESQKVSVLSAMKAQTIDAAWQVFQEDLRGSIEPGKVADFAVLSGNPLAVDGNLLDLKVTMTVRNDDVVSRRQPLCKTA